MTEKPVVVWEGEVEHYGGQFKICIQTNQVLIYHRHAGDEWAKIIQPEVYIGILARYTLHLRRQLEELVEKLESTKHPVNGYLPAVESKHQIADKLDQILYPKGADDA